MKTKSFTLIELLIVIVIIGVLSGIIIISTTSSIDKANFAKAQAFSNTVQNELLGGLVSEWTFDNENNLGEDTWGNNDGVVNGNVSSRERDSCVYGKCVFFDGVVGSYIEVPTDPSLENMNEITISFWFKSLSTGTSQGPISKIYGIKPFWSVWLGSNGRYVWETGDATTTYYKSSLANIFSYNEWHHLVVVQKGTTYTIYSNSEMKLSNSDGVNFPDSKSSRNLLIGSLTTSSYPFKGYLDDVRIYDSALSLAQIKKEYIAGLNSLLINGVIAQEEYNKKINTIAYEK